MKSSWAYRNGQRIMKEAQKQSVEPYGFVAGRRGHLYAENGVVKTYANKKQADKKVDALNAQGITCHCSFDWPFVIMKRR